MDAVRVVRQHMRRAMGAGKGGRLGYDANWPGESDAEGPCEARPRWAGDGHIDEKLFGEEVAHLRSVMPAVMGTQRARRCGKLEAEAIRRGKWCRGVCLVALAAGMWAAARSRRALIDIAKDWGRKGTIFFTDHVVVPGVYMYEEFFTSKIRPAITDKDALVETRASLSRMLSSWLTERFPNMDASDVSRISDGMDVQLIESEFEKGVTGGALKNIITGDLVKMGLIEVQFLKKELLTAMNAIDDLMEANELNLRLGSTMPAFMLFWFVKKGGSVGLDWLGPGGRKSKVRGSESRSSSHAIL